MSKFHNDQTREEVKSISERSAQSGSGSESGSGSGSDEESEEGSEVNIDLSNNEFYKGMCTLLEDDNGNNIVQYVDLLCDHSAALVENTKHIEQMRNDIHRIAKCFERMVSLQEHMMGLSPQKGAGAAAASSTTDEATVKSSKKERDEATVKSSKTHKTSSSKHH
jgi:hypothetical protein